MELTKLIEICKQKEYPEEFSHDLVCMYPFMVKKYGYEAIDRLLTEWKYVFSNKVGASGNCDRNKREIGVNLYNWGYNPIHLYRVVTATIHEVGHALGTLDFSDTSFLNDGKDNNDDFFTKMDEAVVSDYQDELLVGELEYNYSNDYNFKCRGDLEHYDNNYPIEKFYLNVFKILLGNDASLIEKMMYDQNKSHKKEFFEKIVQTLNSKLSDSQFKELINSCALLIYNHGYYGLYSDSFYEQRKEARRKQLYDLNYEMVKNGEISLEEYKKEFEAWFEGMYDKKYSKVDKLVLENNLGNISIREQCDKLSEVAVDYLVSGLEKMQDFDFELIKSACLYFTKVNNRNPKLMEKTQRLNNLLKMHLSTLSISFSESITSSFDNNEMQTILIKLISLNGMSIDKLNNLKMISTEQSTNFAYFTDGESIIKLGRYSDLPKDEFEKYHDPSFQNIYLDIVIPEIKFSRGLVFGDSTIQKGSKITEDTLLKVSVEEKNNKKNR